MKNIILDISKLKWRHQKLRLLPHGDQGIESMPADSPPQAVDALTTTQEITVQRIS